MSMKVDPLAPPNTPKHPSHSPQGSEASGSLGLHKTTSFYRSGTGKEYRNCDPIKGLLWFGIALAVVAIFVAVVSLAIYRGQIQIAVSNVGAMSKATALHLTLGGFGTAALLAIVLVICRCVRGSREEGLKPIYRTASFRAN